MLKSRLEQSSLVSRDDDGAKAWIREAAAKTGGMVASALMEFAPIALPDQTASSDDDGRTASCGRRAEAVFGELDASESLVAIISCVR